ncbi:hypothetical protein EJ05DRAFT_436509 [Pseudovirgaria hyperparasitica]|uniref:Eukaryotic translation initiation factor 5B n=1 Tax=Pseudovirgaria hyperparasitica TaxID=470096 RepID=A0A6A6WCV0_9PEZI|nr:uncharacterized protein EJ05DRAFT_436509 [Pseudovirgaria hyperparasitica]KAF2760662.1 hypothetical protein EJ05DRAFT_436509 [Pseudovirgaria hyperparasitica]
MPPKGKKGKKAQDDWEADLGESVGSTAPEAQATKDEIPVGDDAFSGGLMGQMMRKGKKGKKNKPQQEIVEGEDSTADDAKGLGLAAKTPVEVNPDEDDVWSVPVKKPQQDKKPQVPDEDEDEGDGTGRVKTKKEKEKEKKEREKQRKKEQAAAKKKSTPAPAAKPETAKLAQEAKKEPAPASKETSAAAGGKKKKVPAALAALQKQQEELRLRQEEEARLAAEEKERLEQLDREAEEEAKRKEEAKQAKKLKEKQKIEQLKKEGKYMTKAQKEAQAKAELRLKQLVESGNVKVAGLGEEGTDGADQKKKPTYDRKRKGKKGIEDKKDAQAEEEDARKKMEELRLKDEGDKAAAEKAAKEAVETEKAEASDDQGDWEDEAEKDGIKDSWDADSEEEIEQPVANAATTTNGKSALPSSQSTVEASDSEENSEEDSEDDSDPEEEAQTSAAKRAEAARKAAAVERRQKAREEALAARSKEDLRSPICCILGHVDTGKTKLLDKIRQTNVQEGEAGGITQQIGATYFPAEALKKKTQVVNKDNTFDFRVPGLLVIDTPGHESFTNLRTRGSSLCNMAILVIDIMHGLEPQTIESLNLLKARRTPFIVALNKIDRLYGWNKTADNGFQDSLSKQKKDVKAEFADRLNKAKIALAEQGLNSELFYENKSLSKFVSIVPTSAHTGEGIPDLLKLLITLTQDRLTSSLMYLSEVECTVLEVKVIEGLGTTIDVVLSNGILREGDRIVLCGKDAPIATNIRALLTPAEMKELRIKSQYVHNKEIKAAMGIKIAADGLDGAIAGSRLLVVGPDDDEDDLMDDVLEDLRGLSNNIAKNKQGVSVQASTLGSLEALLEYLRVEKVPVANISIGPIFKRDVLPATIMLEKAPEYAMILAFDVKVDKEAQEFADKYNIKIFTADIIYHLFDNFKKHMDQFREKKKEESKLHAVFPCKLKPIAVFNKNNPIVIGVDVELGSLRLLTPVSIVKIDPATKKKQIIPLGRVTSIQREHKDIPIALKGSPSVAVKIEGPNQPMYGRHIEETDPVYSSISRLSIDTLKEFYRDEVKKEEWALLRDFKPLFDIS